MKRFISILVFILSFVMVCRAIDYNFEDYIYPFGCRTYASPDSNGKLSSVTQYSFLSQAFDNYLIAETYIGLGVMSAKTTYRYKAIGNAIVSDVQLRQDAITGGTKYQDLLILFAFPNDDKPYKWTEIERGDKYQCTSEYTYVKAASKYLKAIKITRDNGFVVGKEKHRVIEKSYWVRGYGRLITLVDWDGKEKVSSKLDLFEEISEISEQQYTEHLEYLKKQEEMESFKKRIRPKSLLTEYPLYAQEVQSIIDRLVVTVDSIGTGYTFKVTMAWGKDVNIQDDIFANTPQISESVSEYLTKLIQEGNIRLEKAINPETKDTIAIPLTFELFSLPKLQTNSFDLEYKKKVWQVNPQTEFAEDLTNAADEYRLTNKKAKKLRISARILSYKGKSYFKGVEKIQIRED